MVKKLAPVCTRMCVYVGVHVRVTRVQHDMRACTRVLVSVCSVCRVHVFLFDISSNKEALTEKLCYVSTLLRQSQGELC